jgi:hypothetical protein
LTTSQIVTGIELPALILRTGRQTPEAMTRPLFRAMHQIIPVSETSLTATTKGQDFAAVFEAAETFAAAGAAVADALKLKFCRILGLEAEDNTINDQMDSFRAYSLIALEVRNWLAKEIRADLAVYEILGDVKLIDTGLTAARKSTLRTKYWDHMRS